MGRLQRLCGLERDERLPPLYLCVREREDGTTLVVPAIGPYLASPCLSGAYHEGEQ